MAKKFLGHQLWLFDPDQIEWERTRTLPLYIVTKKLHIFFSFYYSKNHFCASFFRVVAFCFIGIFFARISISFVLEKRVSYSVSPLRQYTDRFTEKCAHHIINVFVFQNYSFILHLCSSYYYYYISKTV